MGYSRTSGRFSPWPHGGSLVESWQHDMRFAWPTDKLPDQNDPFLSRDPHVHHVHCLLLKPPWPCLKKGIPPNTMIVFCWSCFKKTFHFVYGLIMRIVPRNTLSLRLISQPRRSLFPVETGRKVAWVVDKRLDHTKKHGTQIVKLPATLVAHSLMYKS